MGQSLKKLTIKGFKSIEALEGFDLGKLTVLIGANGAGKSNFVDFFRMLRAMADEGFQKFVNNVGGDGLFFLGPKHTRQINAHLEFGDNVYEFDLESTASGGIQIVKERVQCGGGQGYAALTAISSGVMESKLKELRDERNPLYPSRPVVRGPIKSPLGTGPGELGAVHDALLGLTTHHFHDTSMSAYMRRNWSVRDRAALRNDASNIAAFLLNLRVKHKGSYDLIRDTVRMVAPFFDDFRLEPEEVGEEEKVRLEWRQKGSDYPFQAHQLSDGTIRFICLATALLQPNVPTMPATIIIDEPELGLHPFAISLLASLIQSASERTQVIVSTQSPTLLDHFEPKDVVVVNRLQGRSTFDRLDAEELAQWLDEYSVGELWQKNVVRGGPTND